MWSTVAFAKWESAAALSLDCCLSSWTPPVSCGHPIAEDWHRWIWCARTEDLIFERVNSSSQKGRQKIDVDPLIAQMCRFLQAWANGANIKSSTLKAKSQPANSHANSWISLLSMWQLRSPAWRPEPCDCAVRQARKDAFAWCLRRRVTAATGGSWTLRWCVFLMIQVADWLRSNVSTHSMRVWSICLHLLEASNLYKCG